jgi:AraC family transcriptional regulator
MLDRVFAAAPPAGRNTGASRLAHAAITIKHTPHVHRYAALLVRTPVAKALWYIESHFESPLTLEAVAECAGVSRFHLLRAFAAATGLPIMRYVRGRRLSEAARRLASGAKDILTVALDAEYGSHEAFTRAFREQFGVTPETVRALGHLHNVTLLEPLPMDKKPPAELTPPRIENGALLLVAGIAQRYAGNAEGAGIPAQWQRFARYLAHIPHRIGADTYGVCYNTDDEGNMDYLCAVPVASFADLPAEFTTLRVAAHRYAVFWHGAHVSAIRGTWSAIWNDWLPQSEYRAADAPILERYDRRFDPLSGHGGVELWVPIQQEHAP